MPCRNPNGSRPLSLSRPVEDCLTGCCAADPFGTDLEADHRESDRARPLNRVGQRALEAERQVQRTHPGALIVRTGALFGPGCRKQPALAGLTGDLHRLEGGLPSGCFSYVPDLLHVVLDLMIDGEQGVRHLVSVAGGARSPARALSSGRVSLATERGVLMPPLDSALARYKQLDSADRAPAGELFEAA